MPEIVESPKLVEFMLDFHRRILSKEGSVYTSTSTSPHLTFIGSDAEALIQAFQKVMTPEGEAVRYETSGFEGSEVMERIQQRIFTLRGKQVLLDENLAPVRMLDEIRTAGGLRC